MIERHKTICVRNGEVIEPSHVVTYSRDDFGVQSATCSCGWTFERVIDSFHANSIRIDTLIRDHERKHNV